MLIEQYKRNKVFFQRSRFRSSFKLDEKDKHYINHKGLQTIQQHAKDFITQRLAPAFPEKDGKQTPYRGHPVFKAQHAIGVCCRGCLEKWYTIPRGTALREDHIDGIAEMIMTWIRNQS